MNLFVLKYCMLIGGIIASTAIVAGPLNPQYLFTAASDDGQLSADSIYAFGTETFYKELDKPGNEYVKSSVEGYAEELILTDEMAEDFSLYWSEGVSEFRSGYRGCLDSFLVMLTIPELQSDHEKAGVCKRFRGHVAEMQHSQEYFAAAKATATAGSSQGFTIGMAQPRIGQIIDEAHDADIACMKAVLADRAGDNEQYLDFLHEADGHLKEMRRLYPELKVLSNDF